MACVTVDEPDPGICDRNELPELPDPWISRTPVDGITQTLEQGVY